MGLKCKIVYRDGQALALNDSGNISPLYLEALEFFEGNEKKALNLWATAHQEGFQDTFGIEAEEALVSDVLNYLDTNAAKGERMTAEDKLQVRSFMEKNGIESLSELDAKMSSIFKPNGFFVFDANRMVQSGLWSFADIAYAKTQKKQIDKLLQSISGELEVNNIIVAAEKNNAVYRNSENKTIFGTSEIIDLHELDRAIENAITNYQDKEEFYQKIKELPFPEYVDKFYNDTKFANKEIKRFENVKRVPILSFVAGELSAQNNKTYTTLTNTILTNVDNISVEADLEYLAEISPFIWSTSQKQIQAILKEVEASVIDLNIDIIGISEQSSKREEVLALLSSVNNLLQRPTEENMQAFAVQKDALIPQTEQSFVVEVLPESLRGLNIVRLDSSLTENELFEQHGLIKVKGDNLFHKVRRGQISELYDYLYNELEAGRIEMPIEVEDISDKVGTLKKIAQYVNTRETGIESEFQEEISLNQLAFEHPAIERGEVGKTFSQITTIETDADYLKTDFISDFYNYVLTEKIKNLEVYRDILSHFEINDRDITLKSSHLPNIDGIKFEKELRDYAKIKKDVALKDFVITQTQGINEDILALNDPKSIGEHTQEIVIDGDFAITAPNQRTYVKFNNKLYRRVGDNTKVNVFQEIKTKPDPIYYTTNLNFAFEKEQVDEILSRYPQGLAIQELTAEQRQENLKKARMENFVPNTKYQIISEGNTLTGEDSSSFETAKELETKGKSREEIFSKTRWFKVKGNQWRREIGDLVFEPQIDVDTLAQELFNKGEIIINVTDLFNISEVEASMLNKDLKINLKYKNEEEEGFLGYASKRGDQNTIVIDIRGRGIDSINGLLRNKPYRVLGTGVDKTPTSLVNHEWQHFSQQEAGRKVGNSTRVITEFYYRHNADKIGKVTSNQQVLDKLATLYGVKDFVEEIAKPIYLNSIGEREAQEVEARLDDKSQAPSMFDNAIEYDVFDFTKGNVVIDNLGMSYMDVTPTDLKFNQNLVEFIRQKGVQVVTDPAQMQAELDDSMAMVAGTNMVKNPEQVRSLTVAVEMKSNKYTEREIKLATGWEFDDITGKWKYELDTSNIQTKNVNYTLTNKTSDFTEGTYKTTINNILDYPELFEAYPKLKDMKVVLYKTDSELKNYDQFTDEKNIYINLDLYGTEENRFNLDNRSDEGRKGILHELQHNVSTIEGFARGGNQATIRRQIENILNDVRSGNSSRDKFEEIYRGVLENLIGEESLEKVAKNTPNDWLDLVSRIFYNNLVGEVESRNVEERMAMTIAEKRKSLLQDTEKIPRSEQIFLPNFLQTPAGNVLGFEKNGIIYLDETQLNTTTTIHELIHVQQAVMEIRAAQGDELAQKIIAKREELFQSDADFWKNYHSGKVGVGEVNPMILGEKGAFNIQEVNDKLAEAKKLKQNGVEAELIELQTGWFEQDGDWKYFSEETLNSFKIKDGVQEELEIEKNLEDVIENEKLFEFYPELKATKIIFYDGELRTEASNDERSANGFYRDGVIHVNINNRADAASKNAGLYSRREVLGGTRNIRKDGRGWFSTNAIAHEISHRIQEIEGFPKGGNLSTIQTYIINKFGIKGGNIGEIIDQIREIEKSGNLTENDEANLRGFKTIMEFRLEGLNPPIEVYSMLLGEIEARSLEYALAKLGAKGSLKDTTFQSIVDEMLSFENNKGKDVYSVKYQSVLKDSIGLDLSSPVYAQRPNETDVDWNTRILKEIEAYVTAPQVAEQLEELKKTDFTLWEKLTSFINNLTNWLKTQIGLQDYKGDIMSMTKEQYVNALGVSVLKDEYTVRPSYQALMDKFNSTSPFANGEIEIIYHHTAAEREDIMRKIDECGM